MAIPRHRLPRRLIELYGLLEGDQLELEERQDGILIRLSGKPDGKLSWEESYREMAGDTAESAEWSAWDMTSGDGLYSSGNWYGGFSS